jgi:vacuolar-type H+-ATPase subunit I/STV1
MKAKRHYQLGAAIKIATKTSKTVEKQNGLGTSEKPNDLTGASSKAISTISIKTKLCRTKKAVKSAKDIVRRAKIKEFLRLREEEKKVKRHEAYEKRRAARMIHSSNKLYLSHRLASIINFHSPQSPIECINLTSQFTNSNSKIIKVTRDTRKLRILMHYK